LSGDSAAVRPAPALRAFCERDVSREPAACSSPSRPARIASALWSSALNTFATFERFIAAAVAPGSSSPPQRAEQPDAGSAA
jgi:hypothetical protein